MINHFLSFYITTHGFFKTISHHFYKWCWISFMKFRFKWWECIYSQYRIPYDNGTLGLKYYNEFWNTKPVLITVVQSSWLGVAVSYHLQSSDGLIYFWSCFC
jgi:hypothetical protein